MFKKYNIRDEEIPAMGFFSRFGLAEGKPKNLNFGQQKSSMSKHKVEGKKEKRIEGTTQNIQDLWDTGK